MCVDAAVWGCMGNGGGSLCGSADPVSGSSLSMESAKASKIDRIEEYIKSAIKRSASQPCKWKSICILAGMQTFFYNRNMSEALFFSGILKS